MNALALDDPGTWACDSFGDPDGDRYLVNHSEAWSLVDRFSIRGLGNRPKDWRLRDLTLGCALREPGNWAFRMLNRNPNPDCLRGIPLHLHSTDRDRPMMAEMARCFLYFYYIGLLGQVFDELRSRDRRFQCPPNLFLSTQNRNRVCRSSKTCPFCLARRANDLYQRLEFMVSSRQLPAMLVTLRRSVDVQIDADDHLKRQAVYEAKAEIFHQLERVCTATKCTGAVRSVQIVPDLTGPVRFEDGHMTIRFDEVRLAVRASLLLPLSNSQIEFLRECAPNSDELLKFTPGELCQCDTVDDYCPSYRFLDLGNDAGLREAIFGRFPGLYTNDHSLGSEGLFVAPQWHLLSSESWEAIQPYLCKGARIFELRGNWRPESRMPRPATIMENLARGRHPEYVRREKLRRANQTRRNDAEDQANELFEQLREHLVAQHHESGKRPGHRMVKLISDRLEIGIGEKMARRIAKLYLRSIEQ